jgi:hypothetical protein
MKRAAIVLALCACGEQTDRKPKVIVTKNEITYNGKPISLDAAEAILQAKFSNGQATPSDDGTLPFTITQVHAQQRPSDAPPFFTAGGTWTYAVAHLDGDPAATFVFGMPSLATTGGPGFADMIFVPTTAAAGARVIDALARALGVTSPTWQTGGVLRPRRLSLGVLGHNTAKRDDGYGGTGTWDTTKLFCSAGAIDAAELYFNVSIADKRGEFAQKDTDYNQDVVACLAIALRDGGLPDRTTANDPTLAAKPIRLVRGKQISKHRAENVALLPTRLLVHEELGDSAALLEVDIRTGATKELYKTSERIEWGRCDETATRCLLKLSKPSAARNVFGGKDRPHLAILEGTKITLLDIPGVELPSLPAAPFSPDGKYVVAETPEALVAYDRKTKQTRTLDKGDFLSLDLVGWAKEPSGWVALVTKLKDSEDEPSTIVDWQLDAGGATKPSKRPIPPERSPVSPDGKRRADFAKGRVTVTVDGKSKPTLALHPTDAQEAKPGCCDWIDNRVVWMDEGYLDTDTMKVSPRIDEEGDVRVEYVRGTRTAIIIGDNGTWLANLVVP